MTDINVETGLPTLPEGLSWRVRKVEASYFGLGYGSYPDHVVVEILERKLVPLERHHGFLWFSWKTIDKTPSVRIDVVKSGTVYAEERDKKDRPVPLEPNELTPAAIFETATRVLQNYNTMIDAAKLLGEYPPKKLPEGGNRGTEEEQPARAEYGSNAAEV